MRLYDPNTLQRVEVDEKLVGQALLNGLVPSVTQVLSIINIGDHLVKWKIKNCLNNYQETGDILAAMEYQDTTGADFGTVCHGLAEAYLKNEKYEDEFEEDHVNAVKPFFNWIDDNVDEVLFTETYFANAELGYGGTADFLFKLKSGELMLSDLKVKKHSYKFPMKSSLENKYQLSAYRNHFKAQYGEMQIANFLCASPRNKFYSGKPLLIPCIFRGQDWTRGFEAAKTLWWERYTDDECS